MSDTDKMIEIRGVSKSFGKAKALSDVSYSVGPGTIFALLGENGAGKTTTIKILLGLVTPDAGEVRVLGLDPRRDSLAIRRRIGYVPEQPALYEWMTVGEMGRFAASFHNQKYWQEYLRLMERFEISPDAKIKGLSKGMKAQVSLALALASDPDLLILDEPTSGLDAVVRRQFMESMVDRAAVGKSVFLSSHQITEVERVADEVGLMKQSAMLYVEPLEEMKKRTRIVSLTFENPVEDWTGLNKTIEALFGEVIRRTNDGRTMEIMGRDICADSEDKIGRLGEMFQNRLLHQETRVPNLEEIFIAALRPGKSH